MEFSKTLSFQKSPFMTYEGELFDELILSWNGFRPKDNWLFRIRVKQGERWSPFLPYAEWGGKGQKSFSASSSIARSFQDGVYPKKGLLNGFQIEVKGDDLERLVSIYVTLSLLKNFQVLPPQIQGEFLLKGFPRQSQMTLSHPRAKDLCSPTSLSNCLTFLKGQRVDPLPVAKKVLDHGFDIYGNWIFNTAQGFIELEGKYPCHVERLLGFEKILVELKKGLPVVVSIQGEILGGAFAYPQGHLVAVIGYREGKVEAIDPAHEKKTHISYPLQSFLEAWGRRKNIAYLFSAEDF